MIISKFSAIRQLLLSVLCLLLLSFHLHTRVHCIIAAETLSTVHAHSLSNLHDQINITCQHLPALSELVHAKGTRSVMYIITHNNESDLVAQAYIDCFQAHDWMFVARSPTTVYFESLMYSRVFPSLQSQWSQYDYVITSTYKTLTRQLMPKILPIQSFANILDLLRVTKTANPPHRYDVIPFLRQNEDMYNVSIKYHKEGFSVAWHMLLNKLGFNETVISRHSNVKGFYRNVFIIKPKVLASLNAFMARAIEVTEASKELQLALKKDAHYVMGKVEVAKKIFGTRYYQLYPFVFERLPIFYLNLINCDICMHIQGPCKFNYKG